VGLLDEISVEQDKTTQNRCPVAKLLGDLSPEDRADLDLALADDGIRHVAIARALSSRGYRVNEKGVAAHRRATCACARG
jgi:hypothetical protein